MIRSKRKLIGLTQKQLAEKLKVNQTAISQWERKRVMPRADKLPKIAEALECNINDLFEEIGDEIS